MATQPTEDSLGFPSLTGQRVTVQLLGGARSIDRRVDCGGSSTFCGYSGPGRRRHRLRAVEPRAGDCDRENRAPDCRRVSPTVRFLERQPRFGWHRGMLIDDATMQVSFLKDLVTLRNPTSEFSFLCYLQEPGPADRLHQPQEPLPAAGRVPRLPRVGRRARSTTWSPTATRSSSYARWSVTGSSSGRRDGWPRAAAAANRWSTGPATWSSAPACGRGCRDGRRPRPTASGTTATCCARVARLDGDRVAARFVVVGAGQSAAEAVAYLHRGFPQAEVCAVFSRYGYSPADDSAFANRIFDPAAVDDYFAAPDAGQANADGLPRATPTTRWSTST